MSRIGKLPVPLAGAKTSLHNGLLKIEGPKGSLELKLRPEVAVNITESEIIVTRRDDQSVSKCMHGLTRSLIANMIAGVTQGFSKQLEIRGVGYRAALQGKKLVLNLGFSHPVELILPVGIDLKVEKEVLTVSGFDKGAVGQFAAKVRSLKPPEPYKGKGVRYLGEYVPQKVGKRAAASGT
ncbi:MAG: 50S ribosomal protein L6 [Candidatus Abawacabacteria bacterium RIFCSPHIGHO2_01_FULL_46_8]|uniref:Large ribosomal subunit protein uL6 n=1 Tax=Candidatus Abawacabacteria bacterium RIFCSPHIGHO2_01_FULL_46_8 TaxID=1817815 RepID=A0A1F4XMW5_9BACT|nr:ribosomal protein L6 [uncultured bacterium]OGC82944.1 MAG: 50S ribosomal protein L6 [Candidatus Abawacabacteria bacterium RIFCSPHIGHO2_01_FULL_46_8]